MIRLILHEEIQHTENCITYAMKPVEFDASELVAQCKCTCAKCDGKGSGTTEDISIADCHDAIGDVIYAVHRTKMVCPICRGVGVVLNENGIALMGLLGLRPMEK